MGENDDEYVSQLKMELERARDHGRLGCDEEDRFCVFFLCSTLLLSRSGVGAPPPESDPDDGPRRPVGNVRLRDTLAPGEVGDSGTGDSASDD